MTLGIQYILSFDLNCRTLCHVSSGLTKQYTESSIQTLTSKFGNKELLISSLSSYGLLGYQQIRTNVRKFFARPSENKRIRKHGWKARMSTPAGRRIIMRRMLKGRHVLTH